MSEPTTPAYADPKRAFGFGADPREERPRLIQYANLQLIASGLPAALSPDELQFANVAKGLLENHQERTRLLENHRAPIDQRIEAFLQDHFAPLNLENPLRLPARTLVLDQHGLARTLSLPADGAKFSSEYVESFLLQNGVLHNPRHDRRTTKDTFHIVEGGLPITAEKKSAPQSVFAKLFEIAMKPSAEMLRLPFTSAAEQSAETFVSLMVRPIVCPEIPGVRPELRMETRFFVPGGLVSNLDFVESIFGNAGDPFIPENDAALDVEHWSGHTGCVILAPQMQRCTKKELGLPHHDQASEKQRREKMCWQEESELYNDGLPFKITCRTDAGVVVTLIADNYFGYCKKEVKTQISYAANLLGDAEEEHAGGAVAFASYSLGEEFSALKYRSNDRTYDDVARDYADHLETHEPGYAVDRRCPRLIYIPHDAEAHVEQQEIAWTRQGVRQAIPLLPEHVYMTPSGYKVELEKHPAAPSWRLIGTAPEGVFCHKPCTVSGGGKSEISKSLVDYMHYGPIFVADLQQDLDYVQKIFEKDYSDRWRPDSPSRPDYQKTPSRQVLDPNRSLGSMIKLLTPSPDYTDQYNDWLAEIPNSIYALAFIIKRFQKPGWENSWRRRFQVDIVNGEPGHELKYGDRKLVGTYLRVGLQDSGAWRTYKLRQDFAAARKIQTEDDISASVTVPERLLTQWLHQETLGAPSLKLVANCESRLFQRPDDAIHRGLDKQTEADLASSGNFISNFEPMTRRDVQELLKKRVDFSAFSQPMQEMLLETETSGAEYIVCSDNPRRIDGRPTKNPRYLQKRPDLAAPEPKYIAHQGLRLLRGLPADAPVLVPVDAVLSGRRNNPPEPKAGIRSLAVYNPIHYQEPPELFMDYICSLTGKSPSTTGFGSEGALTKGPFNNLRPTADLNAALISCLLTPGGGFSTAAGHVGSHIQVDHDISLLIPEIWCRLAPIERDPQHLLQEGLLDPLEDFQHEGRTILASRLGYRINERFVRRFLGRIFDNPGKVFDEALLKPETQDPEAFALGVEYIADAQKRVALRYFEDGSVEDACPPLRALLAIMAYGEYEGMDEKHPQIRAMFTRETMLESDWYRQRLEARQKREIALWRKHQTNLEAFLQKPTHQQEAKRLRIERKLAHVREQLQRSESPERLQELHGFIGADPSLFTA